MITRRTLLRSLLTLPAAPLVVRHNVTVAVPEPAVLPRHNVTVPHDLAGGSHYLDYYGGQTWLDGRDITAFPKVAAAMRDLFWRRGWQQTSSWGGLRPRWFLEGCLHCAMGAE